MIRRRQSHCLHRRIATEKADPLVKEFWALCVAHKRSLTDVSETAGYHANTLLQIRNPRGLNSLRNGLQVLGYDLAIVRKDGGK